ncbi:MAG: SusC/RagA family TonB-linked outer membrane protein, partial [Paludibacteraceae bacterium]
SISGGNKKTNFLISANYFDQKGLVINSDFKRFTSRLNLDHKINDQIKVGVSATGSYVDNGNVQLGDAQWQASGVLVAALQMSPVAPIYDATGAYYINPKDATLPNPVSYREIDDNTIQKRLLANSYIEYSPLKGLTLKSSVGVDNKSGLRSSYLPSTFLHGAAVGGKGTKEIKNNMDLLFNATASYNTLLNEKHNVGALIGYEFQKFAYDGFSALVTNFYTDAFGSNNLGAAQGIPSVNSSKSQNVLASYFTRLSYNYDEKYIAGFTLRCDGSSNFGTGNKWGLFPSMALAWRIIEEDFLKSVNYISNLKLRTSFGQTGNSGIGDKAYAYYGPTEFPFMFGNDIVIPSNIIQLANDKLKWETTTEFNVGVDYGFLKNRISGSIEYYNKVVSDLLAYRILPIYSELRTVADNIGATQLHGFEFDVHTVNIDRKFKWKTDLNLSTYQNMWKERNPDVVLNPWQGVHDPIRSLYGFKTDGIVQIGQDVPHMQGELPGNLIYKDLNGFDENHRLTGVPDGKINDADKVFLGSTDPGFSFGIGNTFEYKGFDLNIFFYGMGDRVLMNTNKNKYLLGAVRLPTGDNNMMTSVKD